MPSDLTTVCLDVGVSFQRKTALQLPMKLKNKFLYEENMYEKRKKYNSSEEGENPAVIHQGAEAYIY